MMRAVVASGPGGPEVLSVGSVPKPAATDRQLLVEVRATAANRADTLQRKGNYAPPPGASEIIGLEAVGVVAERGPSCVSDFKVGDAVMCLLAGGGYAEFVNVDERQVMPKPEGLTFLEAAAIPEVWLTAWQLLHFVGHMQPTDTVLIHAAGSGVGTAATQIAKNGAAKVLVTAGSDEKIQQAIQLGAVAGFNYKKEDWAEGVLQATGGKGVDLVIDCIGGSYADSHVKALGQDSRWVIYGLMGGAEVSGPFLGAILRKRIQITGTTLRARSVEYKDALVKDFSAKALPLLASKEFKTVTDQVCKLEDVVQAHTRMESNVGSGKIIMVVKE